MFEVFIIFSLILLVFVIFPSYYETSEASIERDEKKGLTEVLQKKGGLIVTDVTKKVYDTKRRKPHLNLAFIHMRKSGGTHINHILTEFMYEHGCMATGTDIVVEQKVGVRGVREGVPLDMIDPRFHLNYTKHPPKCPEINYIHEEMMAFHGKYYLEMNIPRRGKRRDKAFSLLTTIRDPIERIGSQAFYGKYSVARTTVNDIIRNSNDSNCAFYKDMQKTKQGFNPIAETELCTTEKGLSNSMLVACKCFIKAMNETKEVIRTNETVWFDWIQNNVGYQDEYMPNYFIKRLVATTSEVRHQRETIVRFNHSRSCIANGGCSKEDQYNILNGIFLTTPGIGFEVHKKHSDREIGYDLDIALNISIKLLQNHFDFIIMDFFSEPRSTVALSRALHSSLYLSDQMKENDNSGMFNPSLPNTTHARTYARKETKKSRRRLSEMLLHSEYIKNGNGNNEINVGDVRTRRRLSTSYRSGMPPNVLKYLEEDNSADMKLYEFALKEFERRSEAELWTHSHYFHHNYSMYR